MIHEFNSLRLSNITKIILLILSVISLILILFLINFYSKEEKQYKSNLELLEISETNKIFQEKIKNIEILLNILGRVIVENNYKDPKKINAVFSKYINYYENHLGIISENESPLLIQYIHHNSNIKVDRFNGIEEYNKDSNGCNKIMEGAREKSWELIFDDTNDFLYKNDYVSSIAFGIKNKTEDFFGMFLVHLNKDHISNLVNYSGNLSVFNEGCNPIFSNKSVSMANQNHKEHCANIYKTKKIEKSPNNKLASLYSINYKDLTFIFEPNRIIHPKSYFFSIVKNNSFLIIILILIITLFTYVILYAVHLKILKQEKLFDYYINNKNPDNNLSINEFLEKIKTLNHLIESNKELTNELQQISNLTLLTSQNINNNINNITKLAEKLTKNYKPNNKEINNFKNLHYQVLRAKYEALIHKDNKVDNYTNLYLKKSEILLKDFFKNYSKELKNHQINYELSNNCLTSNLKIIGNSNLIKIMLLELMSKFYDISDSNPIIDIHDDVKLKKIEITLEGRLDLNEFHKKILRVDFPKTTIINNFLFLSKGLLFAKFIMKIHNGNLKVKKTGNVILTKLLFNKI